MSDLKDYAKSSTIPHPEAIIHFGCWNQLCTKKGVTNNLEKVMETMKAYINSHPSTEFKYVSAAGDNYYPVKYKSAKDESEKDKSEKDKSEKDESEKDKSAKDKSEKDKSEGDYGVILERDIWSGFRKLHNSVPPEIPIYVIAGNHDLVTNDKDKHHFIYEGTDMENDVMTCTGLSQKEKVGPNIVPSNNPSECFILETERKIAKKFQPHMHFSLQFGSNGSPFILGGKVQTIMIDTSMYDTTTNITCYQPENNIETLHRKQHEFVISIVKQCVSKNVDTLVLIGHHPIVSIKMKVKEGKVKIKEEAIFPPFLQLWRDIYKIATEMKFVYLCADTHLYQKGIVEIQMEETEQSMKIEQHIVGTGGTELDLCPSNELIKPYKDEKDNSVFLFDTNKVKYTMESCKQNFGFLVTEVEKSGNVKHTFVEATNNDKSENSPTNKTAKKKKSRNRSKSPNSRNRSKSPNSRNRSKSPKKRGGKHQTRKKTFKPQKKYK